MVRTIDVHTVRPKTLVAWAVLTTQCTERPTSRIHRPQMDYDEENARGLLEELDKDKSGLIDFDEFCTFLARIKYDIAPDACPRSKVVYPVLWRIHKNKTTRFP